MADIKHDFDLLEMPVEGVAAYWLSLKKLVGNKKISNRFMKRHNIRLKSMSAIFRDWFR